MLENRCQDQQIVSQVGNSNNTELAFGTLSMEQTNQGSNSVANKATMLSD